MAKESQCNQCKLDSVININIHPRLVSTSTYYHLKQPCSSPVRGLTYTNSRPCNSGSMSNSCQNQESNEVKCWGRPFVVVRVMSVTLSGDANTDNAQYKASVSAINASPKNDSFYSWFSVWLLSKSANQPIEWQRINGFRYLDTKRIISPSIETWR